jgi:hypothetical protein
MAAVARSKNRGGRVERSGRGQRSAREQQRVTGKKRSHDESRLEENDREKEPVGRSTMGLYEFPEVAVEVQENVDDPMKHGGPSLGRAKPGV